ncbi:MAG: alpha-amylase family glycosyl hydrolase [Steroidobacteraceae bacterium]
MIHTVKTLTDTAMHTRDWWKGAVIYEIYPLSFKDTDGDGYGDLPGIIEKLSYVASLGVDAIWVCPFFKSPMRDFGYDVSDYCAVDPLFGCAADVTRLIDLAHGLGLKVIFDMVPCHTSNEHPWFREGRVSTNNANHDWYIWADAKPDGSPPNNWLSIFGGVAWTWEPRRRQYYFHSVLSSQPALNVCNREVLAALLAVMQYWYDKGVDGFRLDAITALAPDQDLRNNPPIPKNEPPAYIDGGGGNPFLKQVHLFDRDTPGVLPILRAFGDLADSYDPPRFLFAEIGDVDGAVVGAKYAQPKHVHAAFIQDLILSELSAARAAKILSRVSQVMGEAWTFNAFGSHDIARQVSRWGAIGGEIGDRKQIAKLLMALLLSMRGCACIYQGEELGLTDVDLAYEAIRDPWGLTLYPDYKGRDSCRTPMPWTDSAANAGFTVGTPWLPLGQDHLKMAVNVQDVDPDSVLNAYRKFLDWRKRYPSILYGAMKVLDVQPPCLAFLRTLEHQKMLFVFNLSNDHAVWKLRGRWQMAEGHGLKSARESEGQLHFTGLDVYIGYQGI